MQNPNRLLIGQYRPGTGLLHRLDPRSKILISVAVMVVVLIFKSILFYCFLVGALLTLLAIGRIGWSQIGRNLKPVLIFILITSLFHLIFSGHADVKRIDIFGLFSIGQSGIYLATVYSLRIMIFFLTALSLLLTTGPLSFAEGLVALLKPLRIFRVPVDDIGMILFIALRFIPVLSDEVDTIRKSQFIRGIRYSGTRRERLKNAASLIMPLFFSALRRADDLSVAIETRGYRSGEPRSSLFPLRFRFIDYVALTASVAFVGGSLLGQYLLQDLV